MQSRQASLKASKPPSVPSASKSPDTWQGSSNVTTFLRCLHLLDLDLLEDWPGITAQTFSTKTSQQNLQHRVKGVEWSLYRLFELYHPTECLNKLSPFFPPQSSLQSLNLRAALFRVLTELKKNGVLEKDVVLRKTMLDECKGDKFEELVRNFAILVLRKVHAARNPKLLAFINQVDRDQLLPLILAYRHSLQGVVQERTQARENAEAYIELLNSKATDFEIRRVQAVSMQVKLDKSTVEEISQKVKQAWTGDDGWAELLLGQAPPLGDTIFDEPFQPEYRGAISVSSSIGDKSQSLATELKSRIAVQESRLLKWREFHNILHQRQSSYKDDAAVRENQKDSSPLSRFDRHQTLHLNAKEFLASTKPRLISKHKEFIDDMQAELSAIRASNYEPGSGNQHQQRDVTNPLIDNLDVEPSKFSPMRLAPDTPRDHSQLIQEEFISPIYLKRHMQTPQQNSDKAYSLLEVDTSSRHNPHNTEETPDLSLQENITSAAKATFTMASSPQVSPLSKEPYMIQAEPVLPPLPRQHKQSATLLERTRQSMSMVPNPSQNAHTSRHSILKQARTSQVFPVNQFETPGRSRAVNETTSPVSGSSTPRDRLFSEDADYASVFKSRPKIAQSPNLSPDRIAFGLDTMVEQDIEHLNLQDDHDDGFSRPLRRV